MKILNWFRDNYFLSGILFIAAILRFYHIDFQSLWVDELITLRESNPDHSLADIYNRSGVHPPFYYIVVHYVTLLFGASAVVIRSLSAVIGVLGVYTIYLLGKELASKKVGYFAAILLTFNYFHLIYSQEGRNYVFLVLGAILSVYYLVRLLKEPNYKYALLHGVFAALMVNCHFFGISALFAEYLILLYFLIFPFQVDRKKFFTLSAISGFTTLLLYLPTIRLAARNTQRSGFWAREPGSDILSKLYSDYFGGSELTIYLSLFLIIVFALHVFKQKLSSGYRLNPVKDKSVFGFFVLSILVLMIWFLPLIHSYTKTPVMINRYFIHAIPAILLLAALGWNRVNNKVIRSLVLGIFLLISIVDIFIVKDYFNTPRKSQFREVSQFVSENKSPNDLFVSGLADHYYGYYLDAQFDSNKFIHSSIDKYVASLAKNPENASSFWYAEAHGRSFKANPKTRQFLEANYQIDREVELFDAFAKHFKPLEDELVVADISKYRPLKKYYEGEIAYGLNIFELNNGVLNVQGFAFFKETDSKNSIVELFLVNDTLAYALTTKNYYRDDLNDFFKSKTDLNHGGFKSKLRTGKLPPGRYYLAIKVSNSQFNKENLIRTFKFIEID